MKILDTFCFDINGVRRFDEMSTQEINSGARKVEDSSDLWICRSFRSPSGEFNVTVNPQAAAVLKSMVTAPIRWVDYRTLGVDTDRRGTIVAIPLRELNPSAVLPAGIILEDKALVHVVQDFVLQHCTVIACEPGPRDS